MQVASNKLSDIKNYFVAQLSHLYNAEEVNAIFEMLVEHHLKIDKLQQHFNKSIFVSESELLKLYFDLKELKTGKPLQYVMGETFFCNLKFELSSAVLIPRPETEELVMWIAEENKNKKLTILDVGTGSGCIAISLKNQLPYADVFAIDVSENALKIAKENAEINNAKITFAKADILFADNLFENNFDVIVSNPPYITAKEAEEMHKNVLEFEPHLALFVPDNNPLLFYKAIISYCLNHLKNGAKLYFEINKKFSSALIAELQNSGFINIQLRKDISGNERMIRAEKHSLET
jgi:release factor glutamine methyltransferase